MNPWIDRLLMGCGALAGLLLATDHFVEASTLAGTAIFAVAMMRAQARTAAKD